MSAFLDYVDGTVPLGSSAYEKRGIAVDVPTWIPDNCIQCNFCSYVCPHAVIRPVAMTDEEAKNAPEGMKTLPMTGVPGVKFAVTVSVLDCTGCGSCANVCPGKKGEKALVMNPLDTQLEKEAGFIYGRKLPEKPEVAEKFKTATVKGSQFLQPLLEFSGACAGCGETPYAKLVTQLFGDRMYIANATGCSSIWGGSSPSTPYTVNKDGHGPAWANSLFEDNAEYGYGMFLAQNTLRQQLVSKVLELSKSTDKADVKAACEAYLSTVDDGSANKLATIKLIEALEACGCDAAKAILKDKEFLAKKSNWVFGGDGWAFDIGYGGLDHVIASGEDINIFCFNTEVYSNTGGQSSKASRWALTTISASRRSPRRKAITVRRSSSLTRRASTTASRAAWALRRPRSSALSRPVTGICSATIRASSLRARIRSSSIPRRRPRTIRPSSPTRSVTARWPAPSRIAPRSCPRRLPRPLPTVTSTCSSSPSSTRLSNISPAFLKKAFRPF